VLCRTHPIGSHSPEAIVVDKKEFDYWVATYPKQYEFIAQGTYPEMQRFQQLMKEEA
jgi:hypothetical protein